ncbi:MAG: TlpA family protein disulfide reductase [Prevotella sp.]|nr:TlpA family protein disulfide reductase [Prevotella sp.]
MEILKTFFIMLSAFITLTGNAQETDTLSLGIEIKFQEIIGTSFFMLKCQTLPEDIKGVPEDTTSYYVYECKNILCIIGKERENEYYCSLDLNNDHDFSNDYRYFFTRQQIEEARNFTPQRYEDIWVAPNILISGLERGKSVITNKDSFDDFFPLLRIHDFCVGKFLYHGNTYYLCCVNNKREYAITDTIPSNATDLARQLKDGGTWVNTKFPIIHNNLVFKFIDLDYTRQKCRISITPPNKNKEILPTAPYEGFHAPKIPAKDMGGKPIKTGKSYVLLDFWGTWCNPCISIIPHLVKIHKLYPDLQIISIANEQDLATTPKLNKLIKELNMNWTHICEHLYAVDNMASRFDVTTYPTTFIIDPSWKIVYKASSSDKMEELDAKLQEIYGY